MQTIAPLASPAPPAPPVDNIEVITIDRRMTVLPIALIAVLNVADVVLTRVALARGAVEANPLARLLLSNGRIELVKVGLLGLLIARVARRRPTLQLAVACWIALGAYLMVVISNVYVLSAMR